MGSCNEALFTRVLNVGLGLKLVALLLDITCLCLWLTEKTYWRLPAKNRLELNIHFCTIPVFLEVLSGMLIASVFGEVPNAITRRVFLTLGYAMFTVTGVIGVTNFLILDHLLNTNMLVVSVLCCVIAVVLVVDFVFAENFFRKKECLD